MPKFCLYINNLRCAFVTNRTFPEGGIISFRIKSRLCIRCRKVVAECAGCKFVQNCVKYLVGFISSQIHKNVQKISVV